MKIIRKHNLISKSTNSSGELTILGGSHAKQAKDSFLGLGNLIRFFGLFVVAILARGFCCVAQEECYCQGSIVAKNSSHLIENKVRCNFWKNEKADTFSKDIFLDRTTLGHSVNCCMILYRFAWKA